MAALLARSQMLTAVACLLAFGLGAQSDPDLIVDGPPTEWLAQNAPYGWDITLDGKVWVNVNPPGARDDYSIFGNDLYKVRTSGNRHPRVWIRGYHARNPKVRYRESKLLVSIDCDRDQIWTERALTYSADG